MHFKIHREGKIYLIICILLSFIFLFLSFFTAFLFFLVSCYVFYFFRDPFRTIPLEDVIVSPADGVITSITETNPPLETGLDGKFIKVSIFLSIFNVHVNRIPTNGIIKNINYISGKFINATLDKSSNENERNIITIKNKNNEIIIISQIAGLIARRIVCDLRESQEVKKGDRFGIIKFGSRVDLYLPNTYKLMVLKGQTVLGGETIISNPNRVEEIVNSLEN